MNNLSTLEIEKSTFVGTQRYSCARDLTEKNREGLVTPTYAFGVFPQSLCGVFQLNIVKTVDSNKKQTGMPSTY